MNQEHISQEPTPQETEPQPTEVQTGDTGTCLNMRYCIARKETPAQTMPGSEEEEQMVLRQLGKDDLALAKEKKKKGNRKPSTRWELSHIGPPLKKLRRNSEAILRYKCKFPHSC